MLTVRESQDSSTVKYAVLTGLGSLSVSLRRHFSRSQRKYTPPQNADMFQGLCNKANKLGVEGSPICL